MESKTSPRKALARERELDALRLRKDGRTYADIGTVLGVSDVAARKAVQRILAHIEKASAEEAVEVRRLELERLDRALSPALWAKVGEGDAKAIKALVDIGKRRADLLGIDAPKELRHDVQTASEVVVKTIGPEMSEGEL